MRASDRHVTDDGRTGAVTRNPAAESRPAGPSRTGAVPGPGFARAGNVRVAPAASHGGMTAGAWCADATEDALVPAAGAETGDTVAPEGPAVAEGPVVSEGTVDSRGTVASEDLVISGETARRPGRPRSERAEQAIIDATIEALGEYGIDGVRCEDVAARAGVGKATLYRRWSGKEDLLIAAFAAMKHPLPAPRGESVRDDLVALLSALAADADDPRSAQQYALLHGAGERYPRLVARYREQVIEPRRELVRAVLRRGVEAGELRPGIDVEVAMLMLTGAVMARGKHDPTPAAPGFAAAAVDELLLGLAPRAPLP